MISPLWILNSSLLGVLLMSVFISNLLKITAPRMGMITLSTLRQGDENQVIDVPARIPLERIYQRDIFGTFVPKKEEAVKQTLISPIPDFTIPPVVPAPPALTYDFIAPLDLTIKGIIMADEEDRCVAMIEDDTKKEGLYYLGDKIKDAQIIKIAKNRVLFLRGANGQLETCLLRKDDPIMEKDPQNHWKYVVHLVEPQKYELDPNNFKQEFDSLGNFLEHASVMGTVYQKGAPIGVKIGVTDKGDIGEALGLQQGDIITSINNKSTSQLSDRMSIYHAICDAKLGDTISVTLSRAGVDQVMYYKLSTISKAKPSMFGAKEAGVAGGKPEDNLMRSRLQEREKMIRDFKQKHSSPDQTEAISRIRQRLLENLQTRVKDSRVR